jgi:hypothetical protein
MPQSNLDANREQQDRERILADYFKIASIKGDNRELIKRFLLGAIWCAVLVPLLFYLKFGSLNWFSVSFTIFLVVLCLLFALGFYLQDKPEYHTPVAMEGTLADRVGAFWMVACAFGPFFGWLITAFRPTEASWKWQYLARAFLAVILPVITAIPNVPYARGKAALIAIPLLLCITALPISSCLGVLADLHDGPKTLTVEVLNSGRDGQANCRALNQAFKELPCEEIRPALQGEQFQVTWLSHTRRVLAKGKLREIARIHR